MKTKKTGCLAALILLLFFLFFIILFCIIVYRGAKDVEKHPEKYTKNNDNSIVAKYIDVTSEQGKKIEKILEQCGIKNINNIEHDKTLDEAHKEGDTGYRITYGRIDNIILCLNSSKKVCRIAYAGHPLYKKKKIVATMSDYTFTSDELDKYHNMCMNIVTDILKSPSTAKFASYSNWGFSKNKQKITVQGYVDSQNSFGAEIRSDFQLIINSKNNKIKSFIFDGKELINKSS